MKKLLLITGIVLVVYLILNMVMIGNTQELAAAEKSGIAAVAGDEYVISEQDGFVAIFKGGELYLKTDTALASLPKSDRVKIEKGIHVGSLKELKSLIEDYCS